MGSRRAHEETQEFQTGYLEFVEDSPVSLIPDVHNQSERTPQYHTTGYVQSEVRQAPSRNVQQSPITPRPASIGSGNSAAGGAAGYKEPSNNSIYREYGGYQNFLHTHGLRMWNLEDVDEGHKIVAEIKQYMRDEYIASQAPPARTSAQTNRRSKTDWMFKD